MHENHVLAAIVGLCLGVSLGWAAISYIYF